MDSHGLWLGNKNFSSNVMIETNVGEERIMSDH
jgi:hypothetical protein